MQIDKVKKLLNIFYLYETEYAFCIKKGKLAGYIGKSLVEENLSDLDRLKSLNEDPLQLVQKIEDIEDALRIFEKYAVKKDDKTLFPVVNMELEFVGLWGRKELLLSWDKIPQVTKWIPGENEKTASNIDENSGENSENNTQIKIKIEKRTGNTEPEKNSSNIENEYKKKIYWSNGCYGINK